MPGLGGIAGDLFFSFQIAQDEAIFWQKIVDRLQLRSTADYLVVLDQPLAADLRDEVQRQSSVMLASAGLGDVALGVVLAVFGGEFFFDLALLLDTSIG